MDEWITLAGVVAASVGGVGTLYKFLLKPRVDRALVIQDAKVNEALHKHLIECRAVADCEKIHEDLKSQETDRNQLLSEMWHDISSLKNTTAEHSATLRGIHQTTQQTQQLILTLINKGGGQ